MPESMEPVLEIIIKPSVAAPWPRVRGNVLLGHRDVCMAKWNRDASSRGPDFNNFSGRVNQLTILEMQFLCFVGIKWMLASVTGVGG